MVHRIAFSIFAINAFTLQPLEGSRQGYANGNSDLDIVKVLNTTERQWLFNQSYDASIALPSLEPDLPVFELSPTCVHMVITNISHHECRFSNTFTAAGRSLQQDYVGHFSYEAFGTVNAPTSMEVYNQSGGTLAFSMTLKYADAQGGCSLFSVTVYDDDNDDSDGVNCEVYVRESNIADGPTPDCMEYFESCCNPKIIYTPYNKECKPLPSADIQPQ